MFRSLAIALCLSLVLPAGKAMEPEQVAPVESNDGLKRAPEPSSTVNATNQDSPKLLSPEETRALSERAEEPGPDVAGGALSAQHLTYIVIALAAAVFVLIFK